MPHAFVYVPSHNLFVYVQGITVYCDQRGAACGGKTKTWWYRYKSAPSERRQTG
jgi:hypothetical protein